MPHNKILSVGTGRLVSDCPIVGMRPLVLCPQQWDDGKLQGKPSVPGREGLRPRHSPSAGKRATESSEDKQCHHWGYSDARGEARAKKNTEGANTGFFLSAGGGGLTRGVPVNPKGSGGVHPPPGGRGVVLGGPTHAPTTPSPGGGALPTLKKKKQPGPTAVSASSLGGDGKAESQQGGRQTFKGRRVWHHGRRVSP